MIPPSVNPAQNKPPPLPPGTGSIANDVNKPGPGASSGPPPIPKPQPKSPPAVPKMQVKQNQSPPPIPSKNKISAAPPTNPIQQNKMMNKPPPPVPTQVLEQKKNNDDDADGPGAVNKEWPNKNPNQIDIFIVSEGTGPIPSAASAVEIEYTGHLPSGKQFIKHREVIQLGKKQNIKGLEQAVTRIKVGSDIKLWIPFKLAYGARGAGNLIPPNSDLTFYLKLHRIVTQ